MKKIREFGLCGYSLQKNRVYLRFCRREIQRKLAFTVHHTGSTNNIQDLRNFAHFAQKVSTREYKKKPALDGERVYFKTCAQQAQNLRRERVHYSVPFFWCIFWDIFNSFLLLKGRVFQMRTELAH